MYNNEGDKENQPPAALCNLVDETAQPSAANSLAVAAPAKPFQYDISKGLLTTDDCEIILNLLRFSEIQKLGQGCFGHVYSVIRPGRSYAEACKIVNFIEESGDILDQANPISPQYFNYVHQVFCTEVSLLRGVIHENIISNNDIFQVYHNADTQECTIVHGAEWLGVSANRTLLMSGSLMDLADISVDAWQRKYDIRKASEAMLRGIFTQIGGALAYLHSKLFICHNDITGGNIVLHRDLGPTEVPVFKLIDFGISIKFTEAEYQAAQKSASMYDIDGKPIPEKYTGMLFGNPFIQEGNAFGVYLNTFCNYRRNPEITDEPLKKVLLVLSPRDFGDDLEKVTIEWALQKYSETDM